MNSDVLYFRCSLSVSSLHSALSVQCICRLLILYCMWGKISSDGVAKHMLKNFNSS